MNFHADVLLVTVTKVETVAVIDAIKKHTSREPVVRSINNKTYHDFGSVNGAAVWQVRCEMGSGGLGAAQQTVSKAITALSPSAVIMVGIAFGVNRVKQKIGEVLLSERLILYELQRVGTKNKKCEITLRGDRPPASRWLLDRFRSAELSCDDLIIRPGPILSGDKLVDNVDFRDQLRVLEKEAIGGEMEGAGLFVACQDAKVDWILVKAICDWGDGKKSYRKSHRQKLAANNAASFVLRVLLMVPLKHETEFGKIINHPDPDASKFTDTQPTTATVSDKQPDHDPIEQCKIAHIYWLGSDLADAIRLVAYTTEKEVATRCLSQALRHFRKAGLQNKPIEDRLAWIIDVSTKKLLSEWGTEISRRNLLNEIVVIKGQISKFIETKAGPNFKPWED